MSETGRLLLIVVAVVLHVFFIVATVGLASEKNRKPIFWLLISLFLSPITFVVLLFLGYVPRHRHLDV